MGPRRTSRPFPAESAVVIFLVALLRFEPPTEAFPQELNSRRKSSYRRPPCVSRQVRQRSASPHRGPAEERTGFQGGLQGYRRVDPRFIADLQTYSGRTIDVPSLFIGGKSDWGVFQNPGAFERMERSACTPMSRAHLIDGAGQVL